MRPSTPQEQIGSALRHSIRTTSAERLPAAHRPIRWPEGELGRRIIALLVVGAFVVAGCGQEGGIRAEWDEVVERTHLGISCSGDVAHHSTGGAVVIDQYFGEQCERIGLAVWLERPARAVSAWVAGRPVQMTGRTFHGGEAIDRARYFEGYRHPAGFKSGTMRVGGSVAIRLRIVDPDGGTYESLTEHGCCGGWG